MCPQNANSYSQVLKYNKCTLETRDDVCIKSNINYHYKYTTPMSLQSEKTVVQLQLKMVETSAVK